MTASLVPRGELAGGAAEVAASERLFAYLIERHWTGTALVGPDCGVRFNYRIGRFVKSYLHRLPWHDDLYYLQAQGYWIEAAIRLHEVAGRHEYLDVVAPTADEILRRQTVDGAWPYPNREWHGRVATAEGTWGSLGLLAAHRQTGNRAYLDAAIRWHRYLDEYIGYQDALGGEAVNYFAGRDDAPIPNNSAFLLRFLAGLAAATGDDAYLRRCDGMVRFLAAAQKPNGELPYGVPSAADPRPMEHFQCFQYNAFACLDLLEYRESTGDDAVVPIIDNVLRFLLQGLGGDGRTRYACGSNGRHVTYHTAVAAAAFARAARTGRADYAAPAARAYAALLSLQASDGSFPHSSGDYRILADRRPYPRNLAMIAYHLTEAKAR